MSPDVLKCFFRLKLKVDLKDEKKMRAMKKKKRKKNEDAVAKGMRETSATVDQSEVHRTQAKMLEDVFVTFFRIIRKGGASSPLLPVTMECIARFSHLINMELVSIQSERACIAYMESTVVDFSIPPPSFKPISLYLSRSSLSKTPKQVFL